jgi:hypothetical protein
VPVEELNRLRELSEHLGDKLTVRTEPTHETSGDVATSVRSTIRRINELVRKITARE